MQIIQKFVYKGRLPDENKIIAANRNNKFAGGSLKKKYTKYVAWQAKTQKIKKLDKKVNIHCIWYRKDRKVDKDNISTGLKFILDGLQEAKILKNDGWREIGDIHHYFKIDKDERVVVLFELSEDEDGL